MLHIYGHTWPVRWGHEGQSREVLVYSNCKEVELFVNGLSQGSRRRKVDDYPAQGFHWDVKFQPGRNVIKAIAGDLTDEIVIDYQTAEWGAPSHIRLSVEEELGDTLLVQAQLYDANGVRCLDATNYISFSVAGDAKLLDNQGTSTGSRRIQAYNGRALMRIKHDGVYAVAASAEGVKQSALLTYPR